MGLCYQTRMVSVGLIQFNFNIFKYYSIVGNHSSPNFPVNVVLTLVHMYSDATPVITLTYHLCELSGSHLQVPLGLTNHVCQRSHAINVWLWQVRQCDDTGMGSLYMCKVNTTRWSEWQKRRIAEAVKKQIWILYVNFQQYVTPLPNN